MSDRRFDPRPGIIILLIALIVGGGIWWWAENRHRFYPKRWGEVVPGSIYRSGQLHRDLVEQTLRDHGVDVVVCLRPHEADHPDHLAEREAVKAMGIEMTELDLVGDGTGDLDHYVTALKTMHERTSDGQQVLVHCAAGAYRTGVAVAYYRLLVQGADPATIPDELRAYGWRDKSDDRLMPYLDEHMEEMAKRLQEVGVIEVVPDPLPRIPGS